MKNKAIIVTVTILVVIAIISLIYILLNGGNEDNVDVDNHIVENVVEGNESQEENVSGEKVKVDSRRGIEILKNLDFVSKMYSNTYYDELDSYGISNNAKIIAAFIKITSQEEYTSLLQQGEIGTYFSKYDLENVIRKTFADSEGIIHTPVLGNGSYDAEEGIYITSSRGFTNFDYAIEVPYKITEYDDRVEVTSYRIYVNTNVNSDNELEMKVTDILYYDRAMLEKAIAFENGELSNNEYNQVQFIRGKIDSQELDSSKLTSVTYTLKKVEDQLLISDYRKSI
ncbi:MAG: hypothetical protein Q4D02_03020 [Clostridia bacterium]|nr:hypothetical protein [Clostridia bacterium]